jgi:hypothetical protein
MPVRVKKMLGSLFICIFVIFWIWLGASLSVFVPKNRALEMVYYAVFGLGWCVPVAPILLWMEYGKKSKAAQSGK